MQNDSDRRSWITRSGERVNNFLCCLLRNSDDNNELYSLVIKDHREEDHSEKRKSKFAKPSWTKKFQFTKSSSLRSSKQSTGSLENMELNDFPVAGSSSSPNSPIPPPSFPPEIIEFNASLPIKSSNYQFSASSAGSSKHQSKDAKNDLINSDMSILKESLIRKTRETMKKWKRVFKNYECSLPTKLSNSRFLTMRNSKQSSKSKTKLNVTTPNVPARSPPEHPSSCKLPQEVIEELKAVSFKRSLNSLSSTGSTKDVRRRSGSMENVFRPEESTWKESLSSKHCTDATSNRSDVREVTGHLCRVSNEFWEKRKQEKRVSVKNIVEALEEMSEKDVTKGNTIEQKLIEDKAKTKANDATKNSLINDFRVESVFPTYLLDKRNNAEEVEEIREEKVEAEEDPRIEENITESEELTTNVNSPCQMDNQTIEGFNWDLPVENVWPKENLSQNVSKVSPTDKIEAWLKDETQMKFKWQEYDPWQKDESTWQKDESTWQKDESLSKVEWWQQDEPWRNVDKVTNSNENLAASFISQAGSFASDQMDEISLELSNSESDKLSPSSSTWSMLSITEAMKSQDEFPEDPRNIKGQQLLTFKPGVHSRAESCESDETRFSPRLLLKEVPRYELPANLGPIDIRRSFDASESSDRQLSPSLKTAISVLPQKVTGTIPKCREKLRSTKTKLLKIYRIASRNKNKCNLHALSTSDYDLTKFYPSLSESHLDQMTYDSSTRNKLQAYDMPRSSSSILEEVQIMQEKNECLKTFTDSDISKMCDKYDSRTAKRRYKIMKTVTQHIGHYLDIVDDDDIEINIELWRVSKGSDSVNIFYYDDESRN